MPATTVTAIPITPVMSSNLGGYGYDPDSGTVAVQFKNGHIFHYAGVPHRLWREFEMMPSKGAFYSREIKGRFRADKVTGTCARCADVGYLGETCRDCGTEVYAQVKVLA